MDDNYWRARLKRWIDSSGMNQQEFALKSDVSQPQISLILSGRRPFNQKTLDKILVALNKNYHDLFTKNKPERQEPAIFIKVATQLDKDILNNTADDYRGIPLYESGRLAAGVNGIEFDPYETPVSEVVVYKPELHGCAHHKLAALKVGGESMEPSIVKGSIIVVDLSDKAYFDNKVFVVNTPDAGLDMASIKRVQKFEKGFLLLSDNREYQAITSPLDWNRLCVGRVVWMWRNIREI